jgi:hypothetical protein
MSISLLTQPKQSHIIAPYQHDSVDTQRRIRMIDKLEAGKTYRLIDKAGYLDSAESREYLYNKYFKNDCVKVDLVTNFGEGDITGENYYVITKDEYKFFELIQEHSPLPSLCTMSRILTRCQELAAEYTDSRFTKEYKKEVLDALISLLTNGEGK